jgi:hypothetical protein
MTAPFSPPASAAGISWEDLNGALLLFTVHSVERDVNTQFGVTDAVRSTVVVLDGPNAGDKREDTLVFPKALQGQLRPKVGGMVLGRLGKGTAKSGQSAPWLLAEYTEQDAKVAQEWLAKHAPPPF